MPSGAKLKKEATQMIKEGNPSDIAKKFNLAASEFAREGKKEETNQCKLWYRFFAGLSCVSSAYTVDDVNEGIKHFREAKKFLKNQKNQEAQDLVAWVEGWSLSARGLLELWKGNIDNSIDLFEKAGQHYLQVKDRVPDLSDFAEIARLEALSEAYAAKAAKALSGGNHSSFTTFAGESKRFLQSLISIGGEEKKGFYSGIQIFRNAQIKFQAAFLSLVSSDMVAAQEHLKAGQILLAQCIEGLSAVEHPMLKARAQALKKVATAFQQAFEGFSEHLDGSTELLLGKPQLAKKKFEIAYEKANNALEALTIIGQWGRPLIPFVTDLRNRSKGHSRSITLATKHAKGRIAIDAGMQFGLVFVLLLLTFVALDHFNLLQTTGSEKIYVSLIVASVTAFGLNALKLIDLLLPLKPPEMHA